MAVFRRTARNRRPQDDNPFQARGFLAAVGFIVAMVVFGVVTLVRGGGPETQAGGPSDDGAPTAVADAVDDTGSGTSAAPAATAASQPPSAAPAAPCPALDTKDRTVPTLAPAGVTWSLFHDSLLPMSATAGPARSEGEAVRCFAHTPVGALIATAQISTRYSFADDWELIVERSIAPGPERDAARTAHAAAEAATSRPASTGTVMQLAAFKFVSYTDDTAVIQVVRGTDDGLHLASALYTVKWVDGDWRLQVQAGGAPASMVQKESSVSGFAPWQAGGS